MARSSLPPEMVILYHVSDPAVQETLTAHGMPCRVVLDNELNETIGHLAGFPAFPGGAEPSQPEELPSTLVMAGFTSARMDELLAALREKALRVELKAMVTVTNQSWPLRKLILELCRERDAILAKRRQRRTH